MSNVDQHDQSPLKIAGVCAIAGSVLSVAAGATFGNLTNTGDAEHVLSAIAAMADWVWPAAHLSFMCGALLWVFAFVVLSRSFETSCSRALGALALISISIGAAVHIVDSAISGSALNALAQNWVHSPAWQRDDVLHTAALLLGVLDGLWWSVISFFHGLPFVLVGLAITKSGAYPSWLGWVAVVIGGASLLIGVLTFLGLSLVPSALYVPFAVLLSLWMVALGVLIWRRAGARG